MSRTLLPRRTALAVTSSLALAVAGAATATPATAASWEEVTRASGAQGAAPLFSTSYALAVSDDARYAVIQHVKFGLPASIKYYVRDTIADTTRELAPGLITGFYGIDRAGKNALVLRNNASDQSLLLVPLAGGTPKVLLNSDMFVSAAISGDGKTVVYSEGQVSTSEPVDATYRLNVATGVKTKVDNIAVTLSQNSVSDDGSVIAGKIAPTLGGVYYRGTTKTTTPAKTIVSPNGAIVATFTFGATGRNVIARRLSDGYTKTLPVPDDATDLAWIAPDGLQVAFASNREHDPILPARVLNLASGALTPLSGPFAKSLNAAYLLGPNEDSGNGTAISRSGRYAVTRLNEQGNLPLAIVDVQNGDLPGTEAPASASAYVAAGVPIRFTCPEDAPVYTTAVNYSPPQAWVGQAQRLEIVIKADGTELANYGFDNPTAESGVNVEVPDGTQLVTYDIKIIDAAGRTLITKDSAAPVSYCFNW